jgi:hypothetical protein
MALPTSSRAKKEWARGGAKLAMHDDQDQGLEVTSAWQNCMQGQSILLKKKEMDRDMSHQAYMAGSIFISCKNGQDNYPKYNA